METSIITIAGIFFICFSVSFIVLNILIKNKVQNGKINEAGTKNSSETEADKDKGI